MSPQQVFSIANSLALVSWIMLAILPRRPWVTRVVTTKLVPGLFAILYTAIVVSLFWRSPGGFSTLASVGTLFSSPWLLLAGWVHYLAFDLLIGSWELEDSRARGIPHLMVVPCLLLTFMFGPAGWLLYRIVRSVRRRDLSCSEVLHGDLRSSQFLSIPSQKFTLSHRLPEPPIDLLFWNATIRGLHHTSTSHPNRLTERLPARMNTDPAVGGSMTDRFHKYAS